MPTTEAVRYDEQDGKDRRKEARDDVEDISEGLSSLYARPLMMGMPATESSIFDEQDGKERFKEPRGDVGDTSEGLLHGEGDCAFGYSDPFNAARVSFNLARCPLHRGRRSGV